MTSPTRIETERLILRPFRLEDVPEIHATFDTDPEVKRYTGGLCPYEVTEAYFRRLVAAQERDPDALLRWAVTLPPEGRLIGWCGLQPLYFDRSRVELAYELARSCWGRGYATEAARAMLHCGFRHLGLERIVAVVHPENAASMRVLERCGMQPRGVVSDGREEVLRYELTGEEYQRGGPPVQERKQPPRTEPGSAFG